MAVSPRDEAAQLQKQIADMHASVQRLTATPGYPPHEIARYTNEARAWVQNAQARLSLLMRQGAGIPGQSMTPAQASKAVRKARRTAKRTAKNEARLKRLADGAINQLAPDNPLVATARTLMNENADKGTRKQALSLLVNSLPLGTSIGPVAKAMASEIAVGMFDDDDEDDDDE